jgi:tRNA-specific 2-thiouridylase
VSEEIEQESTERGIVAMSGGVDSSLAAALLVDEGYDVVAISMRLYDAPPTDGRSCCSPDDLFDARGVASRLGVPFYVSNYVDEFRERVIDYFVEEYRRGRTPNPCIACNNHVKFDILLKRARALGGAWLATGHYARVEMEGGRPRLLRGVDPSKDQSYFLFGLPRAELSRIRFPLGAMTKTEVRARAEALGLPTAQKAESQEICFVVGESYSDFVGRKLAERKPGPGVFRHADGRVLGEHDGVHGYTIGQRRGLGISWSEPLYVLRLDTETNTVVVGPREGLDATGLTANECNWLKWDVPPGPFDAEVQIRYRSRQVPARVIPAPDGSTFELRFTESQRGVAPGQAAVIYDGDEVIGGGFIERVESVLDGLFEEQTATHEAG